MVRRREEIIGNKIFVPDLNKEYNVSDIRDIYDYEIVERKFKSTLSPVQHTFLGYTIDMSSVVGISDAQFINRMGSGGYFVGCSIIFSNELVNSDSTSQYFEWKVYSQWITKEEFDKKKKKLSRANNFGEPSELGKATYCYYAIDESLDILQKKINNFVDLLERIKEYEKE